jgi:hypothetical protein
MNAIDPAVTAELARQHDALTLATALAAALLLDGRAAVLFDAEGASLSPRKADA